MSPPCQPAFVAGHNHNHCIEQALAQAVALCKQRNSRLTPSRRRVLELIWQSHQPLGAYQLLAQLAEEGFNSAPPTVYRALEFLLEHGLIHRLASLNAYTGCSGPGTQHSGYFLICHRCNRVQELASPSLKEAVRQHAGQADFLLESEIIELSGCCSQCLKATDK